MKKLILILVLLLLSLPSYSQRFTVKVIAIADGDTFTGLNRDNLQIKFRIYGIDAPEKKQAYGSRAKDYLSSLIFGRQIMVDVKSQDNWGRYLANVYLADGSDISLQMLRAGFAWHYTKFDSSTEYEQAELSAKKQKVGLWHDSAPIAPWDFRSK